MMNNLEINNIAILNEIPSYISISKSDIGGAFLSFNTEEQDSFYRFEIGKPESVEGFTCSARPNMFWMQSSTGKKIDEIPAESQFILTKLNTGGYALYMPLVSNPYRTTLEGEGDSIVFCAETGSTKTSAAKVDLCYINYGKDAFELIKKSMEDISKKCKTFKLRKDKSVPEIVDYFGWCTWDAFYKAVSEKKIMKSLDDIKELNLPLGFIVLDDGWQEMLYNEQEDWELEDNIWADRLRGLKTNAKFPNGFSGIVRTAKEDVGVKKLYVWHALNGYWAGVDKKSLPEFDIEMTQTVFSKNLRNKMGDESIDFWDVEYGLVPPAKINDFYQQYHNFLEDEGIDGVKVDAQARLEALGENHGGRVNLMEKYRHALEKSVHDHFDGELINCMSCSNDVILNTLNSNLMRSSDDFYPNIPESHGKHVRDNAFISLWLGEIVQPDWDMFKSSHYMGEFHAASRAISGGPVYVSDKVEEFNTELINKLVLSDSTVPRCTSVGKPTCDSLFTDPCTEDVLLKIQNTNKFGGVVGLFQCQYNEDETKRKRITSSISPSDITNMQPGEYALYQYRSQSIQACSYNDSISIPLNESEYELVTTMPIDNGFAPIGLIDKMNSGGCIDDIQWQGDSSCSITLRDGGLFAAYSSREIAKVISGDKEIDFTLSDNKFVTSSPEKGPQTITVVFI